MTPLLLRSQGLHERRIGAELVIYDTATDLAHSLDPTTAVVWQTCDGLRSHDEVVAALAGAVTASQVGRALDRFSEAGLLTQSVVETDGRPPMARRRLRQRGAVVAAGALAAPGLSTVAGSLAIAHASATAFVVDLSTAPYVSVLTADPNHSISTILLGTYLPAKQYSNGGYGTLVDPTNAALTPGFIGGATAPAVDTHYYYRVTFTISSGATAIELKGTYFADNRATATLNGTSIGTGASGYSGALNLGNFDITTQASFFLGGTQNTLAFDLLNVGNGSLNNPYALAVAARLSYLV